jgi:hypothetical protein
MTDPADVGLGFCYGFIFTAWYLGEGSSIAMFAAVVSALVLTLGELGVFRRRRRRCSD